MEDLNFKPSKKLIRSKSGLRIVVTDDEHKSPFVISEPEWTPDKEVSNCKKCSTKFGFTTRKHHCRRCGHIYCAACCDEKLDLPRMCFIDPVRICDDCAPATIQENKFFDCHLKVLTDGASFVLNRSSDYKNKTSIDLNSDDDDNVVICKLSQDNRYLIFDSTNGSSNDNSTSNNSTESDVPLSPLQMDRIKGLRIYNNVPVTGVTSMELDYATADVNKSGSVTDCDNKLPINVVRLSTPFSGHGRKQSTSWILAMQQAFKLIYSENNECDKCDGNNEDIGKNDAPVILLL